MKRRGNMMLSSSSSTNSVHRHEATATTATTTTTKTKTTSSSVNHKSIGCMSGIFHLVSRYQHRRKLLTNSSSSSEKQEKCSNNNKKINSSEQAQSLNPKSESQPAKPKQTLVSDQKTPTPLSPSLTDSDLKRFSFDSPRSPTIPSEIRLSVNVKSKSNTDSDNQQRSPALVARLMGLDDFPPTPSSSSSSPSEKRRKLMVALEKCDEDLKTLKNIIDTIRSTNDNLNRTSPLVPGIHSTSTNGVIRIDSSELRTENVKDRATSELMTMKYSSTKNKESLFGDDGSMNGADSMMNAKSCSEFNSSGGSSNISDEVNQPSPNSVLELISSPPSPLLLPHKQTGVLNTGEKFRKKLREEGNSFSFFQRTAFESLPRISGRRLSSEFSSTTLTNRSPLSSTSTFQNDRSSTSGFQNDRCKKEKVEIVNEACLDVVCGERWELGRIGVILEDYMFNELIQETVRELLLGCCSTYINVLYSSPSLPSGSCKKKLCF